ncbi:MAG: lyase family protein [Nanoarchaeota archaeon]
MQPFESMSPFDAISPIDYRYYGTTPAHFQKLQPYLSENALIEYMLMVEVALVAGFAEEGICSQEIFQEIKYAAPLITAEDVYAEEKRIKHLVRALVNCFGKHISPEAKRFLHLTATSHDIICTAEALRYQEFTQKVLLPQLLELERTLLHIADREKTTLQIGRTHGQHAVPITFGFAISEYVARVGERIHEITEKALRLRGQLSGAVGAYNAQSLVVKDPIAFEKKVLEKIGLRPATFSTQIVIPEFMADYIHSLVSCFSVLANISDDMRQLQRTEIGEVGEYFGTEQVGSSTMPHKKNPMHFEHVKSLYKTMMPRMITLYLDQISEHQRDLTNSASSRFTVEIIAGFYLATYRLAKTMQRLVVDTDAMQKNFAMSKDSIIAEPLYVLLALYGYDNAHEKLRQISKQALAENTSVLELVYADIELLPYLEKFTVEQKNILENPSSYIGKAVEKTEEVCNYWRKELGL